MENILPTNSSPQPVIERHELKYTIPASSINSITRFIEPYCSLDKHSAESDDGFYIINSLYFDTRNLEFLQQRLYGKDGRFNTRVRCYGASGDAPYFLEIKHKSGIKGKKYRAIVQQEDWPRILTDPGYRIKDQEESPNNTNLDLFLRLVLSYDLEPKILTQYRRMAFISDVNEYARLTIDYDMRYRLQNSYNMRGGNNMIAYDHETIYSDNCNSSENVIMELKCNIGEVPMWMLDLISTFNLKQQGFSKYMNSSLTGHGADWHNYMNKDRLNPF